MSGFAGGGVRAAVLGALVAVTLALPRAARAEDAAEALDGATPAERVAKAAELEAKDVGRVLDALSALGGRKLKKGEAEPHLDFLAEYAVQQRSRVLRLAAVSVGRQLDAAGFAARVRAHADGTDRMRSSLAAECLGYAGGEEDQETLVKLANSPSISIAVRACEALAKMGGKDQADQLIEIALDHPNVEVADHATWAALDILKKEKTLLSKMKRSVGKDTASPRGIRYAALEAMLADGAEPFKWGKPLEELWKLHAGAAGREAIPINAADQTRREKIEAALAWLKENLPGTHHLLQMSVVSIEFPGSPPDAHLDLTKYSICVPLSYSGQNERQLAYHLARIGTVLFEKRIGNPFEGHRGWENAIFDTFDVCELAGLYNAGKGGINRDQFLENIIGQRPWGGN